MSIRERIVLILLMMGLGLAPFYPEPHIIGKVRWVLGGAKGMEWIDWFDFFLHGIPWIIILFILVQWAFISVKGSGSSRGH